VTGQQNWIFILKTLFPQKLSDASLTNQTSTVALHFHCLGHVIRHIIWKVVNSGSAKKSVVLTWAVICFGSDAENWTRPQKPVNELRSKTRYFACEWEQHMDQYDAVGSFWLTMRNGWHVPVRTGENLKFWISNSEGTSHFQASPIIPKFSLNSLHFVH
jgi:hypothetical protein